MSDKRDQTDGPIESELQSWFKSRRTPAAPPTLRAFAARVGSAARPTTPVRRLAFGWRPAPGSRLAAAATVIAVIVVAGGFLVLSGQRGATGPTDSPLASSRASISPSQTPALATASPAPTSSPSAPSSAASPIDDGGMFGTRGIWATRGSRLYLSTDGGDTWVERTLLAGVALDVASGDVLSSVFALDATHVWTASPGPGSTVPYGGQGPDFDHLHVVVSRSTDGGATWQSVSIPGDWGGTQPVLTFFDREHGFLLLSGLRGGPGSTVFATPDGGATWQRVGGADGLGSVFGASSASTLWAGNEGDAGPVARPILDVSRDGGRTWTDARLPGLVGDVYVNDTLVAPPVFVGQDGAVAVMAGSTDNPPDVRFYRTTDGGRSWFLATRTDLNQNGSASVAVIDPTHFIVMDLGAGVLQSTGDGGATWQQSASSGFGPTTRLRFWDLLEGAAILQLTNGPTPAAGVFRTTDGGHTWTPVSLTGAAHGSGDAATALDVATRFETARAGGQWSLAWGLLSDQNQAALGSVAAFGQSEAAYNADGRSVFDITAPTQDPELVAAALGMSRSAIASEADVTRGFVVFVQHPQIKGASAGSEGLFVAPLPSGEWRIWIVH
jgi:photosystem II stability/assembly factor-like uncharacterized protein